MEEPEKIVSWIRDYFKKKSRFEGRRILITAGPTHERIDAVRFIGNHSSGRMGYALAELLASEGALIELISGPVSLKAIHPSIRIHRVESASEMADKVSEFQPASDILIFAAAVADYTPKNPSDHKIKRTGESLKIDLEPTVDIAAKAGSNRKPGQILVGFALETEEGEANAIKKLRSKNLDLIVLNQLGEPGVGFHTDTNRVTLFGKDNKRLDFQLKTKTEVAADIADAIFNLSQEHDQA
jgi:phosphopantothenoylcysteine decarboxylase/phosphopantothenate--cysteine ligase